MSKTKEMEEINSQLMKLSREREYAEAHKNDDKAKEMNKKIEQLNERKNEIESKWKVKKGSSSPEVDIKNIAEIISKMTGIPVSELTQEEKDKLLKMEELFKERIISQEEAIEAVSNAVRVSRAGLNAPNRPLATFMFIGPTGVGKTEMVKALAWMVFGSEDAVTRIDMSEYMEKHAVARLIGAPPGYIGYDEGGQLTEKIRRRPYSVILLDEIEKAHPDVFNILLQVFDEGRLTDGKGRSVDFTNTIIIATSNLGSDLIQKNHQAPAKEKKDYPGLKNDLMNVLRGFFRPEFLNRVDDIIMFKSLSKDDIKKIVGLQLNKLAQTAAGQDVHLDFDKSVIEYLAEIGYLPEYGARELKRKIKTEIENNLARAMLKGDIKEGQKVQVKYDKKDKKISFIKN
jgi:ATP-dependent Clp protease ATP-binding subunit ClpC